MADVTNELIYEVLKAMQTRLGTMEDHIRDIGQQLMAMRDDLRSVHGELGSIHTDIANLYHVTASMDARLTRIERRLDIIDVPIS